MATSKGNTVTCRYLGSSGELRAHLVKLLGADPSSTDRTNPSFLGVMHEVTVHTFDFRNESAADAGRAKIVGVPGVEIV